MARMSWLLNWTNPPGVGGAGRKEKGKSIDHIQQRDAESKGVRAAHGKISQSERHQPETTDTEMKDAAADGFKKRDWYPSSKEITKERADECEYNSFIISPFCEEYISATLFHHFTM